MKIASVAVGMLALFFVSACSSNAEYLQRLRTAQAKAKLSLTDSVVVAEKETKDGVGVRASLLADEDPLFSVGALTSAAIKEVRIDAVSGKVLSIIAAGGSTGSCPGAISLVKAISIAEGAANGLAVAVEPDDDVACAREVQVLGDDTLWEVKIASSGAVLEQEESDENED